MNRGCLWMTLIVTVLLAGGLIGYFTWDRPPEIPVLSIFCFQGYAEPEWVRPFEADHDCKVRITYTSTIEEMFQESSKSPEAFHLLSIDSGRVEMYHKAGLIQPIDTERLDHYADIRPYFRDHPFSRGPGGRILHVPIVWGTQTLTVNTAQVPPEVLDRHLGADGRSLSLDILTDPALKGRTAFFDEAANVFAIAAIHEGITQPHNFREGDWERVERRIQEWMENASEFTQGIDSEFNALMSDRVWVLLGGNDAILNVRLEQAGIREIFAQYPVTEGTHCWIDGWVITRPTENRSLELAYAYIDRLISDKGQRALARKVGFGPVTLHGGIGLHPAVSWSTYWYADDIENFPAPLYIMAPEESPEKRVERWIELKREHPPAGLKEPGDGPPLPAPLNR